MGHELIILSIKPSYVDKIFKSLKTVELRRIKPKRLNNHSIVLIYASSPIQSILGAFSVKKIIEAPIDQLWSDVKFQAGISKEEFENYFSEKDIGVGIFIDTIYTFDNPIKLEEIRNIWTNFVPPQGFRYATTNDLFTPQVVSLFNN